MCFSSILAFFARFSEPFPFPRQEHRNRERKSPTDVERMCLTMKSTGIVRRVDELGRIVLPIELRRTLNIAEKDSLEI